MDFLCTLLVSDVNLGKIRTVYLVEKSFAFSSFVEYCKALLHTQKSDVAQEEECFEAIYQKAKEKVLVDQEGTNGENFKETLKSVLMDVLPFVNFFKMSRQFLT